jgi:hypothetical protein
MAAAEANAEPNFPTCPEIQEGEGFVDYEKRVIANTESTEPELINANENLEKANEQLQNLINEKERFIASWNNGKTDNIDEFVNFFDNEAQTLKDIWDQDSSRGKRNTVRAFQQEKYEPKIKEFDSQIVEQESQIKQLGTIVKNIKSQIQAFAKVCKERAKEESASPDKLDVKQSSNNRLIVSTLPYVALQRVFASYPELFAKFLPGTDNINGLFAPNSYESLCGILMNLCLTYVAKYTQQSGKVFGTSFIDQVPGYEALIKPNVERLKGNLNPVISKESDYKSAFGDIISPAGEELIEAIFEKTNDVERSVLTATLFSLPGFAFSSAPGTDLVEKQPARWFNNATTKPRFVDVSDPFGNSREDATCETMARLLDMGNDSCPGFRDMAFTKPQKYNFIIDGPNAINRVNVDFSADNNVNINLAIGDKRAGGVSAQAIGDFTDFGFKYEVLESLPMEFDLVNPRSNSSPFTKRGASVNIGKNFISGLSKFYSPEGLIQGKASRYNLLLRKPGWLNPMISSAAHKMIGDLCRDTLELYTKYTVGSKAPVNSSAVLANNDRPAQAMATFMAAALGDEATNSGSCYAFDAGAKGNVHGLWAVHGIPSWTSAGQLNAMSIIKNYKQVNSQLNSKYKDIAFILLACLDGVHDFVPTATFMSKLAEALEDKQQAGGKAKGKRGGAPEDEELKIMNEELVEYAYANAVFIALDEAFNNSPNEISEYYNIIGTDIYVSPIDYDGFHRCIRAQNEEIAERFQISNENLDNIRETYQINDASPILINNLTQEDTIIQPIETFIPNLIELLTEEEDDPEAVGYVGRTLRDENEELFTIYSQAKEAIIEELNPGQVITLDQLAEAGLIMPIQSRVGEGARAMTPPPEQTPMRPRLVKFESGPGDLRVTQQDT